MESIAKKKFETVDEYIASFPEDTQVLLEKMRLAIKQAAPHAEEVISYNMPAVKQHGVLVYYAANKNHIGFYPTGSPLVVFKDELVDYKTSKGAIQFQVANAIPVALVKKIVKYRVQEDRERAEAKKKKVK